MLVGPTKVKAYKSVIFTEGTPEIYVPIYALLRKPSYPMLRVANMVGEHVDICALVRITATSGY